MRRNPYAQEEAEVGPDTTASARRKLYGLNPPSITEAELLALEERHDQMVEARKVVRYRLTHCVPADPVALTAFDSLMQYIGLDEPITQLKDY